MQVAFNYKKSLGQNFIYDLNYLRTLTAPLKIQSQDLVVEVGAGAGTLTQVLAETGCQVRSFEIDQRLVTPLQQRFQNDANVQLIFADALQYDFTSLPPFRLIANVPYYITTPLIMKFLSLPNCRDLNILVADEVAARIVAPIGTAAYGALSVTCQLMAACQIIKKVPRTIFTPQPNVDSAFVSLQRNDLAWDPLLSKLLKGVFAARRKTILNALSTTLALDKATTMKILQAVGLDLSLRPEQIIPTDYAKICAISRKYLVGNWL